MYDAFMTSYSSFDVQLRQRKQQSEQSRILSKKLYALSVKLTRDIIENTVPDGKENKKKYVGNIRRELKHSREQLTQGSSISTSGTGSGSSGGSDDNQNNPTTTDSDFLLGQPPTLDYDKVRAVVDQQDSEVRTLGNTCFGGNVETKHIDTLFLLFLFLSVCLFVFFLSFSLLSFFFFQGCRATVRQSVVANV